MTARVVLVAYRSERPLDEPIGTEWELDRSPKLVGRGAKGEINIVAEDVSRTHLRFVLREDGWWVEDSSTHGTWLDDLEIVEAKVADGMRLRLGSERAHVVLEVRLD